MTQMVVVLCDWVGSSQLAQSLAVTMVILGLVISPGQFLMGKCYIILFLNPYYFFWKNYDEFPDYNLTKCDVFFLEHITESIHWKA